MRLLVALLALSSVACSSAVARVDTSFTPDKLEYAEPAPAQVSRAVLAYRGDLPALLEAGGEVLGQMEGSGNGFAEQSDVENRIRRDAAARGATHVIFIGAHEEQDQTPVRYRTRCAARSRPYGYGSATATCTTTSSGGHTFYRPRAGYTLVRVPREGFAELPVALGGRGTAPAPDAAPEENWAPSTPPPPPPPVAIAVVEPARDHEARERCRARALERYGVPIAAEAAPAEPTGADGAATGWGARFARVKTGSAPPPPPASADELRRHEAVTWYRGCVARGGRQLAEAP